MEWSLIGRLRQPRPLIGMTGTLITEHRLKLGETLVPGLTWGSSIVSTHSEENFVKTKWIYYIIESSLRIDVKINISCLTLYIRNQNHVSLNNLPLCWGWDQRTLTRFWILIQRPCITTNNGRHQRYQGEKTPHLTILTSPARARMPHYFSPLGTILSIQGCKSSGNFNHLYKVNASPSKRVQNITSSFAWC